MRPNSASSVARDAAGNDRGSTPARVIELAPERGARTVAYPVPRCTKCESTFVAREPAFVHCRYCGHMMRIVGGGLMEQDTYEMRSGLRSIDALGAGLYG